VPPASGLWRTHPGAVQSYTDPGWVDDAVGGYYYVEPFVDALACAVERGVADASSAWSTVTGSITNWPAWRAGFAADPRWGSAPRSGLPTGLGAGAETGAYASRLLTPGFDSNGVLNAASWAVAPAGEWFQVAGSRITDTIPSAVAAAIPGYQIYGSSGWNSLTDNWNGLTEDAAGGRYWLVCPGGHNGGSFDGIVRFDAARMKWAVEHMPSDPAQWSASYRNRTSPQPDTYSYCWESDQERIAAQAAGTWSPINDWGWDEIFWRNPEVAAGVQGVGHPTSRHNYSAHAYVAATNELVLMARGARLWRFSLADNRWTYKRVLNDGNHNNVVGAYSLAGTWTHLDESRNTVIYGGAADGAYGVIGYDLSANQWVSAGSPWAIYTVADTRLAGNRVASLAGIAQGGSHAGQYWVYDLTTRTTQVSGTVQYEPGLSRALVGSWTDDYYDGASLCFVPPINRYWYYNLTRPGGAGTPRSMEMFEIDPTTQPWTVRRLPDAVGRHFQPHPNLMRKMVWVPVLNAVMLVDLSSTNVWFFKF
jgi:hypothetical protein